MVPGVAITRAGTEWLYGEYMELLSRLLISCKCLCVNTYDVSGTQVFNKQIYEK